MKQKEKDLNTIIKETLQGKESIFYNSESGLTIFGCLFLAGVGIALLEGLFYGKK